MPDTQGLDALATLCGYTAAATPGENSTALDVTAPCNAAAVAALSQQQNVEGAVASLVAQQQQHIQQQQRAQQALQFQQVQQVLTLHRATAAQQQQQQLHQQQAANLPSLFAEQAHQIERLLAMQQIQQQQPVNAFGQGLQALAAQLLGAQQHQMSIGAASLTAFPGKRFPVVIFGLHHYMLVSRHQTLPFPMF